MPATNDAVSTGWISRLGASCREDLATGLREAIRTGDLKPGAAVPSERALCESTGLARGTVRSALELLEAEGGIVCSHGRRRTVAVGQVATRTLAVLANDPQPRPDLWQWPGLDAWMQLGFAHAAFAKGWHVLSLHPAPLVGSSGADLQVGGVLISTTAFDVGGVSSLIEALRARQVPMVGVSDDRCLAQVDRVVHDHAAGCAALVHALAARGARRIQPWWGRRTHHDPWWLVARERGYRSACQELGLPVLEPRMRLNPLIEDEDPDWDTQAAAEAAELAPLLAEAEPPDALLMVNDLRAQLMAHALRGLGRGARRPLLVGYDATERFGVPPSLPIWRPDLTVDRGNSGIAEQAVDLLLERLAGNLPIGAHRRLIPPAAVLDGDLCSV